LSANGLESVEVANVMDAGPGNVAVFRATGRTRS
jgi:hypothetical protein